MVRNQRLNLVAGVIVRSRFVERVGVPKSGLDFRNCESSYDVDLMPLPSFASFGDSEER